MPEINENAIKRKMPSDEKAERSVVGGLFVDNKSINIVSEILPDGSYFHNKAYGALYDIMLELNKEGRSIDDITVLDKIGSRDVPTVLKDPDFLTELVLDVTTGAVIRHHAELVAEKKTLRDLIRVTEDITNRCYADKENMSVLLEDTEKKIFKIVQQRNVGEITPIDQVVMESLAMIEKAAKTTGDVTGLASGFIDLDHRTAGFQPGNLVLIAARPAMGKTSFVLSLAKNVILAQKKSVLMFSLEMSKTELVNRLLSMDSKVDSQKFKTGQLNDADWESLIESGANIGGSKLILDDSSTTIGEIRSKCRKLKVERDIQLVIIDYLQLMNGSGRADSRQQEISEISRALKLLAKELQIPVIALSQLSRQVEARTDHHPMLSDLRESGAIEQDADVVLFIYRDEVYHEDTDKKNIAEIMIAKQRSGPIGTVELTWLAEYTQFVNMAR